MGISTAALNKVKLTNFFVQNVHFLNELASSVVGQLDRDTNGSSMHLAAVGVSYSSDPSEKGGGAFRFGHFSSSFVWNVTTSFI